jgi:hypothetical protein
MHHVTRSFTAVVCGLTIGLLALPAPAAAPGPANRRVANRQAVNRQVAKRQVGSLGLANRRRGHADRRPGLAKLRRCTSTPTAALKTAQRIWLLT